MTENSLTIFTKASQMLAEATTIQKTKELKDLALTAADFAKRKNMGDEAIKYCMSYAAEAERKMGEILKETERNKGAAGGGVKEKPRGIFSELRDTTPTLAELGISKKESSTAQFLADLPDETFDKIRAGSMTIPEAKRVINRAKRIEKLVEITENNKPLDDIGIFPVIYADPPWQYEHPISDSRRIENQYPTMTIDDICSLPVKDITTDDAIIFLWVSTPMLKKGLQVLDAWGFEYRTSMVWVKPSIGPGQWVRQRHELILIGVKGSIPTPKGEDKPDSVIEAPRQEHSKKPEIVYDIIEKMYPELEKVELFCRQPREGWKVWGNQS
jgi:N6-adenosine-specific RNA methylase IME4